jgi:transposase
MSSRLKLYRYSSPEIFDVLCTKSTLKFCKAYCADHTHCYGIGKNDQAVGNKVVLICHFLLNCLVLYGKSTAVLVWNQEHKTSLTLTAIYPTDRGVGEW